ncbi:MAG: anti-sigma factor [Bryobacteraceae bacterium]
MTCRNVQYSLSAHLDGCLSPEERREVLEHLAGCPDCEVQLGELARVRDAVGKLPAVAPPAHLSSVLRVMASQERSRLLARKHPFRHLAVQFHLWVENLMRPLAIPLAGGLVSAMLLFSMLMPTFAFQRNLSNDVQVALFTEPAVKAQNPFALPDEDIVIEVTIDGQGRVIDYAVTQGPSLLKNHELRRAIENKLLFMEFTPATAFGAPRFGKMYLSFNRTLVTVKS